MKNFYQEDMGDEHLTDYANNSEFESPLEFEKLNEEFEESEFSLTKKDLYILTCPDSQLGNWAIGQFDH